MFKSMKLTAQIRVTLLGCVASIALMILLG